MPERFIEIIARALAMAEGIELGTWEQDWEPWLKRVRVVLKAMRDPTNDVHGAGEQALRDKVGNETGVVPIETEQSLDVWQAMIDKALEEQ